MSSVTFSVSASSGTTMSYQWYFNGNSILLANSSSYSILTALPTDAGTYTVKISNSGGMVTSSNAVLSIETAPAITSQPASQAVPKGQSASFTVAATGFPAPTYQWYFNNASVGSGTSATLSLSNVGDGNAGSYYVIVANLLGSVTSSVVTLTVYDPPGIQAQPQNLTVVQGQNASFSVTPNGSPPFSYQWYWNARALGGATSSTLTLSNVQGSQAGTYSVIVTNPAGSMTSGQATLVVDVPAGITTQPRNRTGLAGTNVTFSVVASGTAPFQYQWYFNGTPVGPNNSSYPLDNIGTNNAGRYSVVVQNNWGSITSSVVTLTVHVPAAIQTQPTNTAVVAGQDATFSVAAIGTPTINYEWYFNGASIDSSTNSALTLTNVDDTFAGSYYVVTANNWGSVTSSVVTLAVYDPPLIATDIQDQAVTAGQPASFSVVVSGNPAPTYQWYFNNAPLGSATSPTLTLNNVNDDMAGSYFVVAANAAGSVTSSVAMLTVYDPPQIQTQPQNLTVTQGQTASFSVTVTGSAPFGYQWYWNGTALPDGTGSTLSFASAGGSEAGTYYVVVTNLGGSATSGNANLVVDGPPWITTQPQGQSALPGQNVSFSVAAGGTDPLNYQWYFNSTPVGGNNSTLNLNNVTTSNFGKYKVVVMNGWGSVTSSVVNLRPMTAPFISSQPQSKIVSAGESATFKVTVTNLPPLGYQWYFNGTVLPGVNSHTLTLTNIFTNQVGSYWVVVTNDVGSATSAVATLSMNVILSTDPSEGLGMDPVAGFSLGFGAPVGHTYVVQTTSDLVNWQPIATNSVTTSSVVFTDPDAVNYPNRMYRVVVY